MLGLSTQWYWNNESKDSKKHLPGSQKSTLKCWKSSNQKISGMKTNNFPIVDEVYTQVIVDLYGKNITSRNICKTVWSNATNWKGAKVKRNEFTIRVRWWLENGEQRRRHQPMLTVDQKKKCDQMRFIRGKLHSAIKSGKKRFAREAQKKIRATQKRRAQS